MPLRLAGEDYAVVQGLDDLGRLRTITVNDASPGLKVNQQGAGAPLELQAAGASRLTLSSSGQLQLPVQGGGGGLLLGGDVNLYRGTANQLTTDDALHLGGSLSLPNNTPIYMRDAGGAEREVLKLLAGGAVKLMSSVPGGRDLLFELDGIVRGEFLATSGDFSLGSQKLLFGTFGAEDTNLYRAAANQLQTDDALAVAGAFLDMSGDLYLGGGGFVEMVERTAPGAPSADKARLYLEDNGAGKTQLIVKFATGAAQVISTQP